MLLYRHHKNKKVMNDPAIDLRKNPECETFLTFDQWKTFYTIDPEHWNNHKDYYGSFIKTNCWFPHYKKYDPKSKKTYHYFIKFKTARDYRKYKHFIKYSLRSHEDYENTQEILELTKIFKEVADKRAAEARAQTQAAYDNLQKQIEATEMVASKATAISHIEEKDYSQVCTSDGKVIRIPIDKRGEWKYEFS